MVNLREDILKNQITYYNGLIAKHQQNVEIYLNQPVGIGEHSDVMAAIEGEVTAIAQAHEKIEVINHYFLNR
jgi:urease accessory protein UreE|tara:strand:+ start:262 stop:477 length:216 start_codon:yes stop_codon:yes gene_type:complete